MQFPTFLAILGAALSVNKAITASPCCSGIFSQSQKAFLRTMLQDEAKQLQRGMMSMFPKPTDNWTNMSSSPVCFGARGNRFGLFASKIEGFLAAIKLVHVSGTVTCDQTVSDKSRDSYNSKWGCATSHPTVGATPLNTFVTNAKNRVLFPQNRQLHLSAMWYKMEDFDSDSPKLVFGRFDHPEFVSSGQELRLWFGEDLNDVGEENNGGQTCARVYGWYL